MSVYWYIENNRLHLRGNQLNENYKEYTGGAPQWGNDIEVVYVDTECALPSGDCHGLFANCTKLRYIQNLSNLDTSPATDLHDMFYSCHVLGDIDVSGMKVGRCTNFSYMFSNCLLATITGLNNWSVANGKNFEGMFWGCEIQGTFDLEGWDMHNATNVKHMFRKCYNLGTVIFNPDAPLNLKQVTDMSYMFSECTYLKTITNISNWLLQNVTNVEYMFYKCTNKLTTLDLSGWDTSSITNLGHMFEKCTSLESIDVSNWSDANVENIEYLFSECESLKSADLSGFTTKKITNTTFGFTHMFYNCKSLTSVNVSNFDTSNVTFVWAMFMGCTSLEAIDISNFDTYKMNSMMDMFRGCTSLKSLDLRNFRFRSTKDNTVTLTAMFEDCTNLYVIYAGDWRDYAVDMSDAFLHCTNLPNYDYSTYISYSDESFAHSCDDDETPAGYFNSSLMAYGDTLILPSTHRVATGKFISMGKIIRGGKCFWRKVFW